MMERGVDNARLHPFADPGPQCHIAGPAFETDEISVGDVHKMHYFGRELVAWRNAVFVIFILSGLAMATWVARSADVTASES